jgi:hypothetical protein
MPPDIRKDLKRFAPMLLDAKAKELNEADTVLRLCRFFETVLGYDGIEDISREANLKNKFVDVILKVDGQVRLLVEAKAAAVTLRDRHIEQAQRYAADNGKRWVLLTNGVDWNLYHVTFEESTGIEYERAFSVSLATPEGIDEAAGKLSSLHQKAIRKGELDAFWEKATALNPASIGKALFKEGTLKFLRREIRKEAGVLIDPEDLARSLHGMFTPEAREEIGPVKIRRSRASAKKTTGSKSAAKSSPLSEQTEG